MQTDTPRARKGPSFDELRLAVDHGRGLPDLDPAHAPGKRRLGRTADVATPRQVRVERARHQPWVPTSGLVGRTRRSARRG
ncbi:MAG: hypothetical protein ACLGHQ_04560 [Acidimicrobiia bacterium]